MRRVEPGFPGSLLLKMTLRAAKIGNVAGDHLIKETVGGRENSHER